MIFGSYIAGACSGDTLKKKGNFHRYNISLIILKYECDT